MRAEVSDKDKEAACGRGLMFTPSLTLPRGAGEGKKAPAIGPMNHSSLLTHHWSAHSTEDREALP